jgi:hypothetical protein
MHDKYPFGTVNTTEKPKQLKWHPLYDRQASRKAPAEGCSLKEKEMPTDSPSCSFMV